MTIYKKLIRATAFFTLLLLINQGITLCLYRFDPNAEVTFSDYHKKEKINLAIIGTSIPRYAINSQILQDQLQKDTFMLTQYAMKIQGEQALLSELFLSHSPEYVIAVIDSDFLSVKSENVLVQASLNYYLTKLSNRLAYYWNTAPQDKLWLTRLFPWRTLHISSPKQLATNFLGNLNKQEVIIPKHMGQATYIGGGSLMVNKQQDFNEILKRSRIINNSDGQAIPNYIQDAIVKMKSECDKQQSKFFLITLPHHPIYALGQPEVLNAGTALDKFCKAEGIPYINFQLLKSLRTDEMDTLFYDSWHMNEKGAEKFTPMFCKVMANYMEGKDISDRFYSVEEYRAAFDKIVNAWYDRTNDDVNWIYQAHTIQGSSAIAEYRFVAVDGNGIETIIQDYSENSRCVYLRTDMRDKTMRLYVRNKVDLSQAPIIYE